MFLIKSPRAKAWARCVLDLPFFCIAVIGIPLNWMIYSLCRCVRRTGQPRLLFGATPIISLAYIARALKEKGYLSETAVVAESSIYSRTDFDHVLLPSGRYPTVLRLALGNAMAYLFFMKSFWRYDVFHYYFDGGVLRHTMFARLELTLLKWCGKKIVLMPYGSDAFVYDLIPNPIWRHALMLEYAQFGNEAATIQKRIRQMTAKADVVVGCLVHFVNLPRWDILPLTCYPVDTDRLQPKYPDVHSKQTVRIAHACNHRGVKGTQFLIDAVNRLIQEGVPVILDIIEKVSNTEALKRIAACDIYVDQLIFGYAQAALEAMAFGKVVISALDQSEAYELFRRFSYLNECPIVPANTDSIYAVLKALILNRDTFGELGERTRRFVETRHSFVACADMYEAIYQKIWWKHLDVNLMTYYLPKRAE